MDTESKLTEAVERRNGKLLFNGKGVSALQDKKSSEDRWRQWLSNIMNSTVHLQMVTMINIMLCVLHNKKWGKGCDISQTD